MGVREMDRFLERWTNARAVCVGRERERWYALLLLAQGWTAAATAETLERDPHTIGRSAFGDGGPAALIFEQSGGSPPLSARRNRREGGGAGVAHQVGHRTGTGRSVRSARFGISLRNSPARLGFVLKRPKKRAEG